MQLNTRVYLEIEKEGHTYYFSMPFGAKLDESVQVLAEMHNQLVGMIKSKVKEQQAEEQNNASQDNPEKSEGKIIHD